MGGIKFSMKHNVRQHHWLTKTAPEPDLPLILTHTHARTAATHQVRCYCLSPLRFPSQVAHKNNVLMTKRERLARAAGVTFLGILEMNSILEKEVFLPRHLANLPSSPKSMFNYMLIGFMLTCNIF